MTFKEYLNSRINFYKKHFVNIVCGFVLCLFVIDGTLFTLNSVVKNNATITEGVWLWITQPLIVIGWLCMFGFSFTLNKGKK